MWEKLPSDQKNEYRRLVMAFTSLSKMFAQKALEDDDLTPFISSKFQETAFQRAFNASIEDIGNTSYDASLQQGEDKYLVGIKTFGYNSGDQKIAQFKAKHDEWTNIYDEIRANAEGIDDKSKIDDLNHDLYMVLARRIAKIRNARIDSSRSKIKGFKADIDDNRVQSVYHVLMPSGKNEDAKVYVGETAYDKIDIDNIEIIGCTGKNNPTNFFFTDKKHVYKYTAADSQLYMNFDNKNIVREEWKVKYAEDAPGLFGKISNMVYSYSEDPLTEKRLVDYTKVEATEREKEIEESFCWTIWNKNGETEMYSGFNSFFGTGSKMGVNQRKQRIANTCLNYENQIAPNIISEIERGLKSFLLEGASSTEEKAEKVRLRQKIVELAETTGNDDFKDEIVKLVFRPMDEMYIPIPDSAQFHRLHPDFFAKNGGKIQAGTSKLALPKEERIFNLVFEPSGDSLPAYITQDNGKAIESAEKQTYLGEWILRGVFQLNEYEPLTSDKLAELHINGLKFTKFKGSSDVHVEFIWIDEKDPPKGFIPRK